MVSFSGGLSGQVFYTVMSVVSPLKWSHCPARFLIISDVAHANISVLSLPFMDGLTHYYISVNDCTTAKNIVIS